MMLRNVGYYPAISVCTFPFVTGLTRGGRFAVFRFRTVRRVGGGKELNNHACPVDSSHILTRRAVKRNTFGLTALPTFIALENVHHGRPASGLRWRRAAEFE